MSIFLLKNQHTEGKNQKAMPRAQQVPKNELFQAPEEKAIPRAQNTHHTEGKNQKATPTAQKRLKQALGVKAFLDSHLEGSRPF
jgi:hypothetical protein